MWQGQSEDSEQTLTIDFVKKNNFEALKKEFETERLKGKSDNVDKGSTGVERYELEVD